MVSHYILKSKQIKVVLKLNSASNLSPTNWLQSDDIGSWRSTMEIITVMRNTECLLMYRCFHEHKDRRCSRWSDVILALITKKRYHKNCPTLIKNIKNLSGKKKDPWAMVYIAIPYWYTVDQLYSNGNYPICWFWSCKGTRGHLSLSSGTAIKPSILWQEHH